MGARLPGRQLLVIDSGRERHDETRQQKSHRRQTVTVKVSAIQELCDYALGFYERQRQRGGDLELAAYQDAMGHLQALEKLFIADTAIVERVDGSIERLNRLSIRWSIVRGRSKHWARSIESAA